MSTKTVGIDISEYQSEINYAKLSGAEIAGLPLSFAMIRLSYGMAEDTLFAAHYDGCKSVGIGVGAYVYSTAETAEQAAAEADNAARLLGGRALDYPLAFDFEQEGALGLSRDKSLNTAVCRAFLDRAKEHGLYPMLYASADVLTGLLYLSQLSGYDIWLAEYVPQGSERMLGQKMWQFGAAGSAEYDFFHIGSVAGIVGEVDCDFCYADYPSIIAEWRKNNGAGGTSPENAPSDAQPSVPVFAAGDEIRLSHAPLFVSADAVERASTVNGVFYIQSPTVINGRIRITTPRGNDVVTGWVNLSDIEPNAARKLSAGDEIRLSHAPLFVSADAAERASTVNGVFYIQSPTVINGRIRITTPRGNDVVTGWVNLSDIEPGAARTLSAGDEIRLSHAPLFVSADAVERASTVNGVFYIQSPAVINGRIRITTPRGNDVVTGWVNLSDCVFV